MSSEPLSIDFRQPSTKEELLLFLGISEDVFELVVNKPQSFDNTSTKVLPDELQELLKKATVINVPTFFKHRIPKKGKHNSGKFRVVWEARKPTLSDAYKTFARRFDLFLRLAEERYPHPCAFGYVRGRSTIENASPHCGKPLILHADIKNFFPSITATRINKKFVDLGIQNQVADLLSKFVTIEGTLPLGLHSSPTLANLVCIDLDDKLDEIARKYHCNYTRYADDITISGETTLPSKEEIIRIFETEGFSLSEKKFRITKPGQSHYVTGLSVADKRFPRAPRALKRRLRQELYFCRKFGVADHLSRIDCPLNDFVRHGVNRIDGTVRYIANIEEAVMPNLRQEWANILEINRLEPSYANHEMQYPKQITFYIDETVRIINGTKILAIALASSIDDDHDKIVATTSKILRSHLVHPYSGGRKKKLEKKKLHYADANEKLRDKYIDEISALPFRGYVAFSRLTSDDSYADIYTSLVRSLLPHRFMGCAGDFLSIVFEENSNIKSKHLEQLVNEVYDDLEKVDNRRPIQRPEIIIGSKAEYPGFSIPDFLLGVWADYIEKQDSGGDAAILRFEWLRDKYRIIFDMDRNITFSRKRPFAPKYLKDNLDATK